MCTWIGFREWRHDCVQKVENVLRYAVEEGKGNTTYLDHGESVLLV